MCRLAVILCLAGPLPSFAWGPEGHNLVARLAAAHLTPAAPATQPDQRKEALMFLVHFIGDMHQPLHCSDNKDRGGNEVRVEFFDRNMNLHSIWDGGLLSRIDSGSEDAVFAELSKDLTNGRAKKWGQGTVRDWAEQSHKTAVKTVYGKLPLAPASGPVKITPEYGKRADPVIKQQIERAGARLATTLNAALK